MRIIWRCNITSKIKKNITKLHFSDPNSNKLRTEEYLKKFNRQKTLEYLIGDNKPIIFDLGANDGTSTDEFKKWWPDSTVHSFEPQNLHNGNLLTC